MQEMANRDAWQRHREEIVREVVSNRPAKALRAGRETRGRPGRVLTEGEQFERICRSFETKRGTRRRSIKAAVLVKVKSAAPLVSPAYDDGTSERKVVSRWMRHHAGPHGFSSRPGG